MHSYVSSPFRRPAPFTVRKGARESQRQINLNYSFIHFSSERGMKPGCVKFITLQTFIRANLKNMRDAFKQLPGHGMCNYDHIRPIFEGRIRLYGLPKKGVEGTDSNARAKMVRGDIHHSAKSTTGVRLILQIDVVYPFGNPETNVSISPNQYTAGQH